MKKILFILNSCLLLLATACTYDTISTSPECETPLELEIASVSPSSCGLAIGSLVIEIKNSEDRTAPVQFSLDNTTFQTSNTFQGLPAGNYTVFATDEVCETQITVTVENEAGLNATVAVVNSACETNTGVLTIAATNQIGQVSYRLDGGAEQSASVFNGLAPGTYQIEVSDESGCTVELEAEIRTTATFAKVETIVQRACAISGCHDGNISPDLRNKNTIIDQANRLRARTGNRSMPPSGTGINLTDTEIADIACWVSDGAPE